MKSSSIIQIFRLELRNVLRYAFTVREFIKKHIAEVIQIPNLSHFIEDRP